MTPKPTQQRIPWLAVLSVHDLRRLFRQVRATGTVKPPSPARVRREPESRRAA